MFLFLVFVFMGQMSCTRSSDQLGEKPVAQVNDKILTAKEFGERLASRLKNYDALFAKQDSNILRIKHEILNEFITSAVIQEFALKSDLASPDGEVESQIDKVRSSYPDDISFRSALAQEGLSLEEWKTSVRQSVYERMIFRNVAKGISDPSEAEIAQYYKANKALFEIPPRVRLRQIVLEKEEDAKRILTRVRQSGGNLEKMAREFSVAPESKNGGDTGWIEKGALEVFDMAFKMSVGSRSDIVKSSYGFHIFEVLGKKAAVSLSLSEAKPKIIATLRAEKEKILFQTWLAEQIKGANVRRDESLLSAITVHTEH